MNNDNDAPMMYDIAEDSFRPVTQTDVDRFQKAMVYLSRLVTTYETLRNEYRQQLGLPPQ